LFTTKAKLICGGIFTKKIGRLNPLAAQNKDYLITRYQNTDQISEAILYAIKKSKPAADHLAGNFKATDKKTAAKLVFFFTKELIPYKREPGQRQTAKSLPRIIKDAKKTGGDCKHYTTTAASLCKALNIPVKVRVISQNPFSGAFNHIYAVAMVNGEDFVIDPCMKAPGHEAKYFYKKDIFI